MHRHQMFRICSLIRYAIPTFPLLALFLCHNDSIPLYGQVPRTMPSAPRLPDSTQYIPSLKNGSLPHSTFVPPPPPGVFIDAPRVHAIRDYSWHFIASPQPREIRQQDLITILVKEISEVSVNSRFDRQRRSTLLAELKEFIRLGKTGNLENAAANEPTIDANLSGRVNSNGRVNEKEEVVYKITATVVEVLPNGNLVLEAQKEIQTNREIWKYSLTGTVRSQDINRDNTALSENIANLQIRKTQSGKVYDSTKRPWGTRLYDMLFPF